MQTIGFLNGVRAFAALTVLTAHCMIFTNWPGLGLPIVPGAGSAANLAVDLFIILSGFLMVHTVHARAASEPMHEFPSWWKFYIRRIFRIAPLYYLCLILTGLFLDRLLDDYAVLRDRIESLRGFRQWIDYSPANMALHISFIFGLVPSSSQSTTLPDWSLSLEMQFYAIFPALTMLARRFGVIRICSLTVPVCLLALMQWASLFGHPSLLLFKLPVFCSGMLLCYACQQPASRERLLLRAAALSLLLTQFWYYGFEVFWIIAGAAIIALLTAQIGPRHRLFVARNYLNIILDNRLAAIGADLSYSVYLLHGSLIAIIGAQLFSSKDFLELDPNVITAVLFVLVLLASLVTAAIAYRFVERPCIDVGQRFVSTIYRGHIGAASSTDEIDPSRSSPAAN